MSGTTNTPTMTKAIDAATRDGSSERTALVAFQHDQVMTREQIRLVEHYLPAVLLHLKIISGIYV